MSVDLRWQREAACVGAEDHELFQLIERGSQLAADRLPHELWDFNRSNFDKMKSKYCSACRVKPDCWGEGERTEDALWSVRGGEDPIAFESERPPVPDPMTAKKARQGSWEQVDGVWVCRKAGHARSEASVYFKAANKDISLGLCIECRQIAYHKRLDLIQSQDDH